VIECVEHLRIEAKGHGLVEFEGLRNVNIRVREARTSNGVPARVSKLAVGHRVPAGASSRRRVDDRDEGSGIDPLPRASYRHATNIRLFVERRTGDPARKLGPAGLKDTVSIGGIGLAEDREG